MREDDLTEFQELLLAAFAIMGKTPAAKVVDERSQALWFQALAQYPLPQVRTAIATHIQRGKFTPTPADIIEHIEAAALRDNRPGGEEAWALALTTLDDAKTVVLTQEVAEAFGASKPVLDASGPISARKTFLEIYERLVTASRAAKHRPHWFISPGSDMEVYLLSVKKAQAAGFLPKPDAPLALEAPEEVAPPTLSPPEQLGKIRRMLLDNVAEKQKQADAGFDLMIETEEEFKRDLARRVAQREAFIAMADQAQVKGMELLKQRRGIEE